MKSLRKSSLFFAVFSVIISNTAFAWNDTDTHPDLTQAAVKQVGDIWFAPYLQNNLGLIKNIDEKLPYNNKRMSILDILKEGVEREDDWDGMRFQHHFHSPITNRGLHQGWPVTGESALAWARGDISSNDYSWEKARESYDEAFYALGENDHATWESKMAETFRSLGQVMHLVQDMAVPAHTRNELA